MQRGLTMLCEKQFILQNMPFWFFADRSSFSWKRMEILLQPGLTGALYAASDEFHQLFVPGRSGQISDVLLDSAGVCFGVLLGMLFWRLVGEVGS